MSSQWNSRRDDRGLKPNQRDDFTEQIRRERWIETMADPNLKKRKVLANTRKET